MLMCRYCSLPVVTLREKVLPGTHTPNGNHDPNQAELCLVFKGTKLGRTNRNMDSTQTKYAPLKKSAAVLPPWTWARNQEASTCGNESKRFGGQVSAWNATTNE